MHLCLRSWFFSAVLAVGCGGSGAQGGAAGGGAANGGASSSSGGAAHGGSPSTGGASASGGGASSGAGGGAVAACGAFTPGNDLTVCSASYLGGPNDDGIVGVGLTDAGSVLVAAMLPSVTLPASSNLDGGGDGAIVRLDPATGGVSSATRLGGKLTAFATEPTTGLCVVGGDFGVTALAANTSQSVWKQAMPTSPAHVAIAADATVVAATNGGSVTVFDPQGSVRATFQAPVTGLNGVAIDSAAKLVFLTGYRQDDGGACSQYKSTVLRAYDYDGNEVWKAYSWTHDEVGASGDCADTQGLAVAVGRDGKLYYAGKSDGGNTVHQKDPRVLAKMAPNVAFDPYNTPYGFKGAGALGYYARFSPASGAIEVGQFLLARKGDTASADANAAVPSAITADAKGNVLVVGSSAYEIAAHDAQSVGGQKVGPYAAYELFLLVVPSDFEQRLAWTVFTKSGPGEAVGVATAGGLAVLGGFQTGKEATTGTLITTGSSAQPAPSGGADGYAVVFPAP